MIIITPFLRIKISNFVLNLIESYYKYDNKTA